MRGLRNSTKTVQDELAYDCWMVVIMNYIMIFAIKKYCRLSKVGYGNNFKYFCSVLNEFKEHIENQFPELLKNKFILACSGGVDSVVLAHLCCQCRLDFAMAHCNFKLRCSESDEDERFVRELAKKLKKPIWVKQFNTQTYVESQKISVQMAARELRYAWFNELMDTQHIKMLVTAHQLDDNLETFVINLSRGTGIKGLIGIPPKTETIARPLLPFSRVRIMEYAIREQIDWREDQSNAETKYLRNKIRHEIIPLLKETHPAFLDNFQATQNYLKQIAEISEAHLNEVKARLFRVDNEVVHISIESLQTLNPIEAYLHGLFNEFGFTAWSDIGQLLTAMSGKEVLSKTHRLVKDRGELLLSRINKEELVEYPIQETTKGIEVPITLSFESVDNIGKTAPNVLYVDKETLKYPLVLRKRQKGDYFYPLGLGGRKKLSKYLKDEKMDIISKEKQWVLCSENKIVWVVGKRLDDRFKITPHTTKILKITWIQ